MKPMYSFPMVEMIAVDLNLATISTLDQLNMRFIEIRTKRKETKIRNILNHKIHGV